MKTIVFLLIFICGSVGVSAQYFEGRITYENTVESKIPGVSNEQFTQMMGKKQEFFIKDNYYKSIIDGTMLQWQIYAPAENRIYTKMSNADTAMVIDASQNPDELVSSVVNKNVETILGRKCDELIITSKNGVMKFYYPSDLNVNHELFKSHVYGNWYAYLSTAKSIFLKSIVETPQFSVTSIAVKVTPEKLDVSTFKLPQ